MYHCLETKASWRLCSCIPLPPHQANSILTRSAALLSTHPLYSHVLLKQTMKRHFWAFDLIYIFHRISSDWFDYFLHIYYLQIH